MPSGTTEPEDLDAESQCRHCGRWYSRRGVLNHEDNCDYRDVPHRVVDLTDPWAIRRADDVDVEATVDGDTSADPAADPVDTDEPQGDGAETTPTAATDGGPREVPDFGGGSDVVQEGDAPIDAPDSSDDPTCPKCGSSDVAPVDDLPEGLLRAAPALAAREWVCVPCSTEGDVDGSVDEADLRVDSSGGEPTLTVEAFGVDEDGGAA